VRVLFDQGTPVPLRQSLAHHEVTTAYEREWSRLKNGELLDEAERQGFEVLGTTDSKLKYQQNLKSRQIANCCHFHGGLAAHPADTGCTSRAKATW